MIKIKAINSISYLGKHLIHPATTFSLGAVFIMFVDTYITKGVDSSFVSAVMDTVMAAATVLAVLAAKNYLMQFTAQEGFKIAIELVNEKLNQIENIIHYNDDLDAYYHRLYCFNYESLSGHKHLAELAHISNKTSEIIKLIEIMEKDISSYLFKMKTYGLHPAAEREIYFQELQDYLIYSKEPLYNYRSYVSALINILNQNTINFLEKITDEDEQNTHVVDFKYKLENMKEIFNYDHIEINENLHNVLRGIKHSYAGFFRDDHHITKLFNVR